MPAAPLPQDEVKRLAALLRCHVLDSADEEAFDDIALVASQITGAPVALVSLVDADRQWFKARVGMDMARETPRDVSFCAHAILQREPLVVPDTREDERFSDNPLVTGLGVRFYAGVPIAIDDGSPIGTLCILDYEPRTLRDEQLTALRALARQLARELRQRSGTQPPGPETPATELREGDRIDDWTVVRPIGRGAFGHVYETRRQSGERAAIKILTASADRTSEVVERFAREARVLQKLDSTHVARIYDVGNLSTARGDAPYIALEYVDGIDLGRVLADRKRIPWQEAARWFADVADALGAAHALDFVHRDVKPANIMLVGEAVKVIDFGLAKAIEREENIDSLTRADMVVGSIHYMSPEQLIASSAVDGKTDVWSLAVSLYELMCGRLPWNGTSELEIAAQILQRPPVPMRASVADVPADLEALVRACLTRAKDKRPDMPAVAATLRATSRPSS
jgi:tRNA A-37 threonylcarbamoyl transferase component Bud32